MPHDLAQINTWLGKAVRFDVEKPVNAKVFTPSTTLPHTVKHVHSPKGVQRATRSHRPLIKASRHHTSPSTARLTSKPYTPIIQFNYLPRVR